MPLVIGHRGAAGHAPEHTRSSFLRAVESGAEMIELDVHLTADAELVVIHDPSLERTTHHAGLVREYTLPELQGLECGGWFNEGFNGERIMSLRDVCALLPSSVALNVEVKSPDSDFSSTSIELLRVLRDYERLASTVVSAFDWEFLRQLRSTTKELELGLLTVDSDAGPALALAKELNAYSIHPYFGALSETYVVQCARLGYRVFTWTVNDPEDIVRVCGMGVDGVISDFPDRVAEVLKS